MAASFRLSNDDDLLSFYPRLEEIWPRQNADGSPRNDWSVHHDEAARFIERRLRASKSVPERFQLGRLSPRSRADLREASACLALSYIFRSADTQGDDTGYYDRNSRHFEAKGIAALSDASLLLDYDVDNSGTFDTSETQQPFPIRLIRG